MGLVKREDLLLYGVTAAQHVVVTVFASKVCLQWLQELTDQPGPGVPVPMLICLVLLGSVCAVGFKCAHSSTSTRTLRCMIICVFEGVQVCLPGLVWTHTPSSHDAVHG